MPVLLLLLLAASAVAEDALPIASEDQPYRTAVTVTNPNDRAVRIARVDTTCTCTQAEPRTRFLLPHASTRMDIAVDDANRSGDQRIGVTLYLSDPDLDPIEAELKWTVRPTVAVDLIAPGMDPAKRPDDANFRDVYRFTAKERPDELSRLKKRIRLSSPPGEVPDGGLKVLGVDYAGTLWAFATTGQPDGSVLITATAKDPDHDHPEGLFEEQATVRTNHPRKSTIALHFIALIAKDAGSRTLDPDAAPGMRAPPVDPTPPPE